MNYELIKNNILGKYETETSEKFTQIYSQREGTDSPGSFGFKRAGKINK